MGIRKGLGAVGVVAAVAVGLTMAAQAKSSSQREVRTIGPGMTADQVRTEFGQPTGTSSRGEMVFWFYDNGCERECGFPDLVIFQGGQVVDAVLRAPWHDYAGESSSPKGTIPRPTPGGEPLQMPSSEVQGVEVRPAVPPARVEEADTARADTSGVRG